MLEWKIFIVLLLSVLSCASALAYGARYVHLHPSGLKTLCKASAVGPLVGVSLLSGGPVLLTCALALGTLGDVFLSRDGERNLLFGLVAFLLGHLCYIAVLMGLVGVFEQLVSSRWRLGACLLLLGIAGFVLRRLLPHLGDMRVPVLIYAIVILAMGIVAFNLPTTWPLILAILGATLFIASDAVLGFEIFVLNDVGSSRRFPATLLWFLYWSGQTLILIAILAPM